MLMVSWSEISCQYFARSRSKNGWVTKNSMVANVRVIMRKPKVWIDSCFPVNVLFFILRYMRRRITVIGAMSVKMPVNFVAAANPHTIPINANGNTLFDLT